jgi:hypothetical protein
LLALFAGEADPYVAVSLAWGLNRVTGEAVDLKAVASSKPGEREEFCKTWGG